MNKIISMKRFYNSKYFKKFCGFLLMGSCQCNISLQRVQGQLVRIPVDSTWNPLTLVLGTPHIRTCSMDILEIWLIEKMTESCLRGPASFLLSCNFPLSSRIEYKIEYKIKYTYKICKLREAAKRSSHMTTQPKGGGVRT